MADRAAVDVLELVRARDPDSGAPELSRRAVVVAVARRGGVAAKQASGLIITTTGIVVTVCWSHRIACREGVLASPRPRRPPEPIR